MTALFPESDVAEPFEEVFPGWRPLPSATLDPVDRSAPEPNPPGVDDPTPQPAEETPKEEAEALEEDELPPLEPPPLEKAAAELPETPALTETFPKAPPVAAETDAPFKEEELPDPEPPEPDIGVTFAPVEVSEEFAD